MGFLNYLLLGIIAFASGWAIRVYVIRKSPHLSEYERKGLKHPTIMLYLAIFFGIMLIISWLLGTFVLQHEQLDIAFIMVNSLVATFIFSFGLSPEQARYDLPD